MIIISLVGEFSWNKFFGSIISYSMKNYCYIFRLNFLFILSTYHLIFKKKISQGIVCSLLQLSTNFPWKLSERLEFLGNFWTLFKTQDSWQPKWPMVHKTALVKEIKFYLPFLNRVEQGMTKLFSMSMSSHERLMVHKS